MRKELKQEIQALLKTMYDSSLQQDQESKLKNFLIEISNEFKNPNYDPEEIYQALITQTYGGNNLLLSSATSLSKDSACALLFLKITEELINRAFDADKIINILKGSFRGWDFASTLIFHQIDNAAFYRHLELAKLLLINKVPAENVFSIYYEEAPHHSLMFRLVYKKPELIEPYFQLVDQIFPHQLEGLRDQLSKMEKANTPKTIAKLISFYKTHPQWLYQHIRKNIIPETWYPQFKGMKTQVFAELCKANRSQMLADCLSVDIEKTGMHQLAMQKRGFRTPRKGKGLFKLCSEKADEILAQMEREEAQKHIPEIKYNETPSVIPVPPPIPVPPISYGFVPAAADYQPTQTEQPRYYLIPIENDPPPSFVPDLESQPQPPFFPLLKKPELIDFDSPPPAPKKDTYQELLEMLAPLRNQTPVTPITQPVAITATQEIPQEPVKAAPLQFPPVPQEAPHTAYPPVPTDEPSLRDNASTMFYNKQETAPKLTSQPTAGIALTG